MKSLIHILMLFLIALVTIPIYAQSSTKTWTETTASDFSDNQLNNVIVRNDSGGEVQLQYPLTKTINDYKNNSYYRYTARDSSGNFVRAWVKDGNVLAQKYSAGGKELSKAIKVNEGNAIPGIEGRMVALLDNGTYMVIWNSKSNTELDNLFGQIITNDSVKDGSNFQINDRTIGSKYANACPTANNKDNCFELFYSLRVIDDDKIYFQKRDVHGNMIGINQRLNNEDITQGEYQPKAVADENGYWVVWYGAHRDISPNPNDGVYLRHYRFDGTPIIAPIHVFPEGKDIALCLDRESHLFLVWLESTLLGGFNVYGQLYDSTGVTIGNRIRLNSLFPNGNNQAVDVELVNNEFQISWLGDYLIYINRWKFDPKLSGEMVSSVFDASPKGCTLKEISWNYQSYIASDLKFQIRSGSSIDELNNSQWYGPTGTSDYYTANTGEAINNIHNGSRYIQYKAYFNSEYGNSAGLTDVNIKYSPNDNVSPQPPLNLTASNNHVHVSLSWNANTDKDVAVYKIYRGSESQKYDTSWCKIISKDLVSYTDSSALVGKKYYYAVTAIDSSHNESIFSNEALMMFSGWNFYVSASGNPSGSGSIDDPIKTIRQGMALASPGDTLKILPGSYTDGFDCKNRVSIIGTGASECLIYPNITIYDDCVIKGLSFFQAIKCKKGSPLITENVIGGSYFAITLYDSASPTIAKNLIKTCNVGIYAELTKSNSIIRNNIIKAKDLGMQLIYGENLEIVNNVICVSGAFGIDIQLGKPGKRVENNISYCNNPASEYLYLSSEFKYNDFWSPNVSLTNPPSSNLVANPLFVNEDIQDYHLLSSSLCKNAGNPDPIYNNVDGTRNDIGAYGGPDPFNMDITSQLSRSIYVSSLSGYPGDTVAVYVSLNKTDALAKADFKIEYDNTLLNFLNAKLTDATASFSFTQNILSANKVRFSLSSSSAAVDSLKSILQINFVVNQNSKTNDASPLTIKDVTLFDSKSKEIVVSSLTNGAFVVNNTKESSNYIYVDASNTGNEDGSRKFPFNTITAAINAASAGDTIWVAGGSYGGTLTMKEGVALIGSGSSVTTFTATGDNYGILFNNVSHGEISGFTFKSDGAHLFMSSFIICHSSSPVIKKNRFEAELLQNTAVLCEYGSNIIFEDNYLKDMDIFVDDSSPEIKNNFIDGFIQGIWCYNNSNPVISGNTISAIITEIQITKSQAVIKNNTINRIYDGYGIFIDRATDTKVFNNIINVSNGRGSAIKVNESQNVDVVNNTILAKATGIEETSSTINIMNNIIVNSIEYGVNHSSSSIMDYNAFWNNTTDYTEPHGSSNIHADVMFADTSKEDYRLLPNSPCINAGNPGSEFNDVDGSRNDIGAYGGQFADSSWMNLNGSTLAVNQVTETDTIQIQIKGENVKGIAGIKLALSYDPAVLTLLCVNSSELTKSFSIENTNHKSGLLNVTLNSSKGIVEDEGKLIELKFAAYSSKTGTTTTLHFDSANAWDETAISKNIYDLKDGQLNVITGVDKIGNHIPESYSLSQNYPNPFNPLTKLRYELPVDGKVSIKVYDILGRLVATLVNEACKAGKYEVEWDASRYASGVYIYKISANDFVQAKKMLMIK